jgi:hypothetical protein
MSLSKVIQPLNVVTISSVLVAGRRGYYFPRGWVECIYLRDGANLPAFSLIGDGELLGHVARHGAWTAKEQPRGRRYFTPLFEAVVPRSYHAGYMNLNHYKEIVIEFESAPPTNLLVFEQHWTVPVWADTKMQVFTGHYPPDTFLKGYDAIKKLKQQYPTVKLKRSLCPIRQADPLPLAMPGQSPMPAQILP